MFDESGGKVLRSGRFKLQSSQCNFEQFLSSRKRRRNGKELEHAINLLATSQNSSSISVHCMDDLEYLQTRGLEKNLQVSGTDKSGSSTDRMPDKHHTDFIKKTMQLHEDIFKQQVRELHRLYSVQKILMLDLEKEIKQNRKYWAPITSPDINCYELVNRPNSTALTTCGYSFHIQSLREDPSSRESGSRSGETVKMARGFDLERPADEDISTGVSAVDEKQAGPSTYAAQKRKMSVDGSDEDIEVELTLSIGGCTGKKISKNYQTLELDSPASFESERGEDRSIPRTPLSSSNATFDQDRKRPHWIFQSLSINRT
ncbi:hypothetical protein OIU79_002803 [Salix purpurea]|uniref:Uncharacterized protein n=1 Tax=Salix purpurea TaxID=77065 RepID=A0A9Q0UK24_SALPP|nr:hypothetical protein OIU79_002803 [Salix purpurea]